MSGRESMGVPRRRVSGWYYECPCGWWTEEEPGEHVANVADRVQAHRDHHRDALLAILDRPVSALDGNGQNT